MIHERNPSIQQIEHDPKKESLENKQTLDYFDLNAQVLHLLLFKNLNFITDALIFEEISSYLTKTIPICNFQKVNLSLHEDASVSEVICAFSYPNNQWNVVQVLLLENLRFDHLKELDSLSNIRYIGFMNRSEFERAWNDPSQYRKLIFLEYSTGFCKPYMFPELRSEQELTDYYIQYGSFATADKIMEMKERARMLNELFMEKGKTAVAELTSMIESFQLDEHSLASLLEFTVSFYDLKPGCFEFLNIYQKNTKVSTPKATVNACSADLQQSTTSKSKEWEKPVSFKDSMNESVNETDGIKMKFQDILSETQGNKNHSPIFEGFTAIWNEELGPIVIDHYPQDSIIDKETLAIQFFMTFETVFGQSPMKKTELILPLAAFNKTAIIHLDLLENESVRGGKQPFIIAILTPESFSLIEINCIKPSIESALQTFKSEHTSNVEALIECLSKDLEAKCNQTPSSEMNITRPSQPTNSADLEHAPKMPDLQEQIKESKIDPVPSEIKQEQQGIALDISQSPKILPHIEKEVKTLNQLNKLPSENHQNTTNTTCPLSNESVERFSESGSLESQNISRGIRSSKSVERLSEPGSLESAKDISKSISRESEPIKENRNKSKNIPRKNKQLNKNCQNDTENTQKSNIDRETLLRIKQLIELPMPDISDMQKMEAWFEAKNRMLRLFFESGMAEL